MIILSGVLVVAAIALLVAGIVAGEGTSAQVFGVDALTVIYVSIGVSIVSLLCLIVGVILRRKELFGSGASAAAADRRRRERTKAERKADRKAAKDGKDADDEDGAVSGPAPEVPADAVVHVVRGRKRYHLDTCRQLAGRTGEELTYAEAKEEGFSPCTACMPDTALAARAAVSVPAASAEGAATAEGSAATAVKESGAGDGAAPAPLPTRRSLLKSGGTDGPDAEPAADPAPTASSPPVSSTASFAALPEPPVPAEPQPAPVPAPQPEARPEPRPEPPAEPPAPHEPDPLGALESDPSASGPVPSAWPVPGGPPAAEPAYEAPYEPSYDASYETPYEPVREQPAYEPEPRAVDPLAGLPPESFRPAAPDPLTDPLTDPLAALPSEPPRRPDPLTDPLPGSFDDPLAFPGSTNAPRPRVSDPAATHDDTPVHAGRSAPAGGTPAAGGDDEPVRILSGTKRYHRIDCALIEDIGDEADDLEALSRAEAKARGCTPCLVCQPDRERAR
ncbi:hypothetical protein [Actinomadura rayongensis]|uniref:Uncharacterized protein n=1 Tax=Actinomadura rayongensis TaxID=1429076 RepID=A0A6I4W3S8_9ACTN|nr:hypothetical protein [Actinomadura rayongensis]MXQ64068.1 hypothetical protein [Actinomadura rayongensis]